MSVQPVSPELDDEMLAAIHRQHLVETVVQRIADQRETVISLEERATLAAYVNEVFLAMSLEETARVAALYHDYPLFRRLLG
jgi:hypothetical protein